MRLWIKDVLKWTGVGSGAVGWMHAGQTREGTLGGALVPGSAFCWPAALASAAWLRAPTPEPDWGSDLCFTTYWLCQIVSSTT